MKKQLLLLVITTCASLHGLVSQETGYGPGYQTIMITNPAFAGSEGDGVLRLSYFNFYPGRNYNIHSFFASYDAFSPLIHGGAGFFITNDYMGGVVNDIRGGFSYSYHLQAGEDIFINAGLGASFCHRGFNRNNMVFPDQVDPLGGVVFPTSETGDFTGQTVFDVSAGFLMIAGRYLAGLSVSHLAEPDLSGSGAPEDKLARKVTLHLSGSFPSGRGETFIFRPLVYGELQGSNFRTGAGTIIEAGFFAINSMLLINKAKDLDLQSGISFKTGQFFLFYNYCFNLVSKNSLLPASLFQQAGMGISLNYVDKRKIIKTINFPKL